MIIISVPYVDLSLSLSLSLAFYVLTKSGSLGSRSGIYWPLSSLHTTDLERLYGLGVGVHG